MYRLFVLLSFLVALIGGFIPLATVNAMPKCPPNCDPPPPCEPPKCVPTPPPPTNITITGKFHYKDKDRNEPLRPIAFAEVEIWSFRSRCFVCPWTWGKDFVVTTNANGTVAFQTPFPGEGVTYSMRVFAKNYAAIVWPNDVVHTVPFHREPGEPGSVIHRRVQKPGDILKFDFDFVDDWASQHYNLADTVRYGFDYAAARRDPSENDPIPPVNVQPTSASPTGTYYNPIADTLVIDSSMVFKDRTILHEYAHFLEEQISSFAWIPSVHNGCDGYSPEHAWMEGFADYFAQAVYVTNPGKLDAPGGEGTPSIGELEAPWCSSLPSNIAPEAVENFVAGELWDLFDRPQDYQPLSNEQKDHFARHDGLVFQIFDRELDTYGRGPTIMDFRKAWQARFDLTDHLNTISSQERDYAIREIGYIDDGVVGYVYGSQVENSAPLFRLWSDEAKDHFYTTSVQERDEAIASYGYADEGIICYLFASPRSNTVPVYRLWNPFNKDHLYTTSEGERRFVSEALGYEDEGIAGYILAFPAPGTTPMYRLFRNYGH